MADSEDEAPWVDDVAPEDETEDEMFGAALEGDDDDAFAREQEHKKASSRSLPQPLPQRKPDREQKKQQMIPKPTPAGIDAAIRRYFEDNCCQPATLTHLLGELELPQVTRQELETALAGVFAKPGSLCLHRSQLSHPDASSAAARITTFVWPKAACGGGVSSSGTNGKPASGAGNLLSVGRKDAYQVLLAQIDAVRKEIDKLETAHMVPVDNTEEAKLDGLVSKWRGATQDIITSLVEQAQSARPDVPRATLISQLLEAHNIEHEMVRYDAHDDSFY